MKKVIIIGGGVAGMSAGIYLARAGISCEIYEKNAVMGGNLTAWERQGCTVDNCIHWLTGTREGNAANRIWHEVGMLGEGVQVQRREALYESEYEGERIAFLSSPLETAARMRALSPADKRQINRFIRTVRALERFGVSSTVQSRLGLLLHLPSLLYYKRKTLDEVAKKFRHPLLRLALCDYIGGEFSAIALLLAYSAYTSGNGSVPVGGSRAAAERMASTCQGLGCTLHTGIGVSRIVVSDGRVTGIVTTDGEEIAADYVIAACDPSFTFGELLPEGLMPRAYRRRAENPQTPIFSAVHTAFVCDSDAIEPFGTRIISAPPISQRGTERLALREFSHEKSFAPAGKTVLQTLVFLREEEAREWISLSKDCARYRQRKEETAALCRRAILDAMPKLKESLTLIDVWTPATYHRYVHARSGAFLSYAMTPKAPLRMLPSRVRALKGLSIASQWQASVGGLPTAAKAGRRAAEDAKAYLKR